MAMKVQGGRMAPTIYTPKDSGFDTAARRTVGRAFQPASSQIAAVWNNEQIRAVMTTAGKARIQKVLDDLSKLHFDFIK